MPQIPVPWGEVIDKITILQIKSARLTSAAALEHVRTELGLLEGIATTALSSVMDLADELTHVNTELWDIENHLREKERARAFDEAFIGFARSVYRLNDRRAAIKRKISMRLSSELVEEKSYE